MIRSTFFGFTTALRGMSASQKALDVTGQNIGNVNTNGYTRQRADFYSSISGGYNSKYASIFANDVGNGVIVGGISQIRDPYLDVRFRKEANKLGEIDSRITSLKDLAAVFDETMTDGLKTQVADVISKLNSLTKNTGNSEFDGIVKASMDIMAKMFNQYANQTGQIRDKQDAQLKDVTVPDVNQILKNIANLNKSIKEDQSHGNPALELLDQRNMLIDELSSYMNISVSDSNIKEISNGIVLSDLKIEFLDANNKPIYTLLEGENASELTYGKDSTGKTIIGLKPASGGNYAGTVTDMNDILNQMSSLNEQIDNLTLTTPPTEDEKLALKALTDQQGLLSDKLSGYLPGANITTVTNGDKTYRQVTLNGTSLVQGDGTTSPINSFTLTGKKVMLNGTNVTGEIGEVAITDDIASGILKGTLDMLNKSGEFDTPPNTSRGIGYYEKMLDTIVSKLADEFNTMNSMFDPTNATINPAFDPAKPESTTNLKYLATGAFTPGDPGNTPPGALYPPGNEWKPLFSDRYGNVPITAKGLAIADGWVKSEYGITATKKPLNPKPGEDNSGQSENIVDMIALFDKKFQFNAGSGEKLFLGSFQEVLGQVNNVLALDKSSSEKTFKNYLTVLNGIDDSRAGISSVSLDEEGVNLLRYQKSFNAAARLMTTLDEAISTIIHNMGRVGV